MLSIVNAWQQLATGSVYVVQGDLFGIPYLESPEEQGLSEGPHLLRVFMDREDAERYREALEEYQGPGLTVGEMTLENLWGQTRWNNALQIQLCSMAPSEWARPVTTIWEPGTLLH